MSKFVKGQSGNPHGRTPDSLSHAMKKLTREELEDIASTIIKGTPEDLNRCLKDKNTTLIKLAILSVVKKIIDKGDMESLDKLLNRMIGKVTEKVNVTGEGFVPTTVMLNIPDNGRSAKKLDE